jgi:hypothetical protein
MQSRYASVTPSADTSRRRNNPPGSRTERKTNSPPARVQAPSDEHEGALDRLVYVDLAKALDLRIHPSQRASGGLDEA